MLTSRISAKGQLTIPSEVRKRLRLRPGDTIAYAVSGETATIRKIDPLDAGFLRFALECGSARHGPGEYPSRRAGGPSRWYPRQG